MCVVCVWWPVNNTGPCTGKPVQQGYIMDKPAQSAIRETYHGNVTGCLKKNKKFWILEHIQSLKKKFSMKFKKKEKASHFSATQIVQIC